MFIFNTDTCDHGEVTGLRFTFPSWDPLHLSIRWETHHHRFANVNEPQYWEDEEEKGEGEEEEKVEVEVEWDGRRKRR
jgi:hypothetical protein